MTKNPLDTPVLRILLSDITARKQVDLDYRIAACVFESPEGMMITDARQVILRVNKAFTDITGYSTDDVLGKEPHMLCSGEQGVGLYAQMWRSIELSGAWQGEALATVHRQVESKTRSRPQYLSDIWYPVYVDLEGSMPAIRDR